jgi:hypothetical protein
MRTSALFLALAACASAASPNVDKMIESMERTNTDPALQAKGQAYFERADTNSDGKLTKQEVKAYLELKHAYVVNGSRVRS